MTALLSWFADRPVGVKLGAILAVALLGMSVLAGVGVAANSAASDRSHELDRLDGLTRSALEADMMRDAVRGDVLRTMLAGTAAEAESARADLREHETALTERLAALAGAGSFADVRAAAAAVRPEIDDYLRLATSTAASARPGQPAPAGYREFQATFSQVEEQLPAIADALEAHVGATTAEVAAQQRSSTRNLVLTWLGGALLLAGSCALVLRGIVVPLGDVSGVLHALAAGDLSRTSSVSTRDEVGRMAAAADSAAAALRETVSAVAGSAQEVATAAGDLMRAAQRISDSAETANAQIQVVSTSAGQVSANVQTVADGSGEMGASIQEIARNANEASQVASEAVSVVASANATMTQLADSSAEIGNVIKLISSIAEQTNLLALNATIEAARAGDAGKGFAVVAGEVKDLAQETARATEDISNRIAAIQDDTLTAVEAIGRISTIIDRINGSQTTIASAVEQQTATTNEMNRNVAGAAAASTDIADNLAGVVAAAATTSAESEVTATAARELSVMAERLTGLVGRFRY